MTKQTERSGKPRGHDTRKRRPTAADSRVGESIRAHRLIAGMSQDDLAKRLGVSFQQVHKYEKGANRVGAGRLPQIAEILGVRIGAFFNDRAGTGAIPFKLITDTATVRLLTAYAGITDRAIRRDLSDLVERIAHSAKKQSGDRIR
ncbi:helix-turn-helix transcriptional regulator [Bradyrhizobium sp.]|uniref:helix-turn-helix domain-containing protein n=1 Tax=Bradyrhizobium sp. TaxID=376 RepID=UPI002DFC04B9|nr:helix-turn-helix transcriptional regulator [Bradyrhizobium sp.]